MSNFDYPLPTDVQDAWRKVNASNARNALNPALIFDRYSPRWDIEKAHKNLAINQFTRFAKRADLQLLKAWNMRWETSVSAHHATPFTLETDWRFVTGLGSKGPLEIGFNFHRYGFPYLPGSGLKGLARNLALIEVAEKRGTTSLKLLNDEVLSIDSNIAFKEAFADDQYLQTTQPLSQEAETLANNFRLIFGTNGSDGQSGLALFYDGIPDSKALPELDVDIMNPHFPAYYRDPARNAPTDSQNPIPVLFLAVAPGQSFRFAIGWRSQPNPSAYSQVYHWLKQALLTLGAGAKTSSGYGYFKTFDNNQERANAPDQDLDPNVVQITQLINNIQNMRSENVAGQIYPYVEAWRTFEGPVNLKKQLAQAIKEKVESVPAFKSIRKKEWYQQLIVELS